MLTYINIHSHHSQKTDDEIVVKNLAPNQYSVDDYCSVGIHPWFVKEAEFENDLLLLTELATKKNVLAIGECGLDKLVDTDFLLQEYVFKQQIKIAEQVRKPIIVHCVKAFDALVKIKKDLNITVPMIVHGYNNNKQIAEQLVKNDFYLSFGKALLKNDSNASDIIAITPNDKFFLETDDSELSIQSVYETAASLKGLQIEELKKQLILNFKTVFYNE